MNLLEHYILEVKDVEEIPEHEVEMIDENEMYVMPTTWKLTAKVDCYGSISTVTKFYVSREELDMDLKRGYFYE